MQAAALGQSPLIGRNTGCPGEFAVGFATLTVPVIPFPARKKSSETSQPPSTPLRDSVPYVCGMEQPGSSRGS